MDLPRVVSRVGLLVVTLLLFISPLQTLAVTQSAELLIREVNITGEEFVVLQNAGSTSLELSEYWLGYSSNDTTNYIVPTQQLPSATLQPGQAVLLNNGSTETCDASIVDELGFSSLSNTKGILALRHLTNNGNVSSFSTVDSVAWGKLPADHIQIAEESKLADDDTPVWYRDVNNNSAIWRVGDFSNCSLTLLPLQEDDESQPPTVVHWAQSSTSPPSVFIGLVGDSKTKRPFIPASNKGLKAPQLSEILPNPASPQLDANDEFIELYNPNDKSFELSGFMLQTASLTSSTTRTYTFPVGTKIAPRSFKAFKSSDTNISLSNTGGQVWFVDPLGTTLDKSEPWESAKDGQAWVDANGKWQWTLQATPGATNKIATPVASNSSSKTATVNGKKVTGISSEAGSGSVAGSNTVASETEVPTLSVHPLTLAVIIAAALLYGAYEYRHDMALKYQQFRRNRAARR